MKIAIVLPYIHLFEPIDFGDFKLEFVASKPTTIDQVEQRLIKYIPFILSDMNLSPSFNFSIAFVDTPDSFFEFQSRFSHELDLLRFHILTSIQFFNFEHATTLVIGLRYSKLENVHLSFDAVVNQRQFTNLYTRDSQITRDTLEHPSSLQDTHVFENRLALYRGVSSEKQSKIIEGINRYVAACVPDRYTDLYGMMLNLVSGIEVLIGVRHGEGNEKFGLELSKRFSLSPLRSWGRKVYKLGSDLRHGKLVTDFVSASSGSEKSKYLHKSPDEKNFHTSHYIIAKLVLEKLIQAELYSHAPSISGIGELLKSNETPIKQLVVLANAKEPIGEKYYKLFDRIRSNPIGSILIDCARITNYVLRSLNESYPNKNIFSQKIRVGELSDLMILHNSVETIKTIERSMLLGGDKHSEKMMLFHCHSFLSKMSYTLSATYVPKEKG